MRKQAKRPATPAQANLRANLALGREIMRKGHDEDFCAPTRCLGGGYYSTVYEGYGGQVVKVGRELDGGYVYALWCMTQDSPHVPKVEAVQRLRNQYDEEGYVVVMERLSEATYIQEGKWDREWHHSDHEYLYSQAYKTVRGWEVEASFENVDMLAAMQKLRRWVQSSTGAQSPYFDLHDGNVMVRGDTLVVTDPLAKLPTCRKAKFNRERNLAILRDRGAQW